MRTNTSMDEAKHANVNFTVVLEALLDAAGDSEKVVRESVCKALQKLAKEKTADVVDKICSYKEKKGKMTVDHNMVLLNVLEFLAQECQGKLGDEVVAQLIGFSVDEMLKNENNQMTQSVLSNILIALGTNYCNQVLTVLIPKLQPGYDPNPHLLMTLGHLACANVMECVPVMKVTLDIMIPMMPSTRNEQLRIALAFVIGKFCEALEEYMSSSGPDKDENVTAQSFAEEIVAAYTVIANSWVQAKEVKVTESAICCLGPLFSLLPEDKAGQATSRAITCLLNAYRRPCIQHNLITSCLAQVLSNAPPSAIIPVLDQVLHSLGNMVIIPPDYSLPQTVKQHSEVLRCYDHIGKHFTERLIDLLWRQLKIGNEKEKVESLIVIAHLISGSDKILESRMHEIIPAMAALLQDTSVKAKKALVKAIVALFCKNGNADGPYHVGNSNEAFIEFLVKNSVLSQTSTVPDCIELSNICTETIHLLSSTVDSLRPCLWNTLLSLLTNPAFDTAVPIITKALTQIAPKTSPEEVAPNEGVIGPSLETVLCRSFAFLGCPLNNNRGPSILMFLQQFARYLSPHISDLWAHKLPQLIKYLLESEWNEAEWDVLLLEVISSTVTTISCHDSNWPVEMSRRLTSLLSTAQPGDEENVLLCTLAITTAVIEDKQHVAEDLETILLRFKSGSNIKVCARAVGILSSAHLEMVLNRLEQIAKTELNRRNSRLLGLMKDMKVDAEIEKCREVLCECYAAIAQRCPLMELFPKLEPLTQWILTQISIAKEGSCRNASLEAILNCAESLVRNKNSGGKYMLKNRADFLTVVIQLIQQNKPDPLSLRVITVLIKLPPPLLEACRTHILKICFDRVLSQDPPNNGYDHVTAQQTLKQLGELVEELLVEDIGPDTLDEITTLLEPWIRHRNAQQRLSGITIFRTALLAYYHNLKLGYQNPSTFNQSGDLIGSLVVRIFDSNEGVGKIAAHATGIVLAIASVYEGHSPDVTIEKIFENLPEENTALHIAKVLCGRLPHAQMHKLTARLLDGLTDFDQTACSNASDILACVFNIKGAELFHYVNDIIGSLLLQLFTSGNHPSNGVNAVIALAKHHPKLVMNNLLKQSLPLHSSLSECWKLVAGDPDLNVFALEHLLHAIQSSELYNEDNKNANRPKIAALHPLAAICALSEMVDSELIADLLRNYLAELLPSLMTTLAAYIGATPPVLANSQSKTIVITNRDAYKIVPAKVVKDCLQRVLTAVGCDAGSKALSSTSQLTHIDALVSIVPQLTVNICQTFPLLLPKLMVVLNQYSATTCELQRIIITAFYAECLAVQCSMGGDASLVDSLVGCLESAATAPDHTVRAIALRGLRYIAELPKDEREKHLSTVLTTLLDGLEDSTHSRVPLESLLSLSVLIPSLSEDTLTRIQLPLASRLKPFFEKEEIGLRSGSLRLFGQLYCKDRSGQSGYREHLEGSLICLLVHLSEPEPSVVKACKFSLREAGPVLNAKKVSTMFHDHLIDDANLHYEQFVTDLVKSIIEELDHLTLNMFTTCTTYMKSNWPAVRGNAALLAGLIYMNANNEKRNEISLEQVLTKLLLLATDSSPEVRAKAIQAMALMYSA